MWILFTICFLLVGTTAWAHKPSDSYLSLEVQGTNVTGQWDIALRDLEYALGLDHNEDGAITYGEVRKKHTEIAAYALAHLDLSVGGLPCRTVANGHLIDNHTDGAYDVLRFTATCPADIERLTVEYRLLFGLDAQHKGLLRLTGAAQQTTAIFSQSSPIRTFAMGSDSAWLGLQQYTQEGIWHIWLGFDHLLFLLTLLLPSVLIRQAQRWEGAPRFSCALREVIGIVTAFTLAHSLTLSLATFGVVRLPSRLVESTIAASVLLAALANFYPDWSRRRRLMAFTFGLVHGFGFAAVLFDLGLQSGSLLFSLVGFNVGVEIGQLAVVALFLPLAYALRHSPVYQPLVLKAGSVAVMCIAFAWLVERAWDFSLFAAP